MDAVADGTLPAEQAGELVLLVAVVGRSRRDGRDGGAPGEPRRDATGRSSTRSRPTGRRASSALVDLRDGARNAFYSGE